ncbi:lipoprotein, type 6 [Trypanosoma rangeli]|uniref:Lipoprotein, type 6 n=1 Tax=Trypanosoma rangeli TaxID=5698 RepID=A0A3R7KQ83_TRYRA|nr:lipoprotein, type 6 [Trypanosoma rangeli]RNF07497.1 lipoprotein, type 6 [Trypanosoma rangeli]|eukprot:RNF07497.1 lipoprotein, type 6 [Trypanosoma rangeli]
MSGTAEVATAAAAAPSRRMPPWLLTPGGPKEPSSAEFRAKMAALAEEKRALLAEVRQMRASLGPREGREATDNELAELRQRMGDIDARRKMEQEMRFKKNEEIQRVQKLHDERQSRLRELSEDLGGFTTLKEIDNAIALITRKMETSGGGLAAEKRTVRQLSKLEEAKRYLVELQPLTEAITEAKHREAMLQREWQEINDRIRSLWSEYNEQRATKQQKEQEIRVTGVNRSEVYKKCEEVSSKINKLSEEMNRMREEHNKAMEAWNAWREEARAKYLAKMEAERKERQRRYLERKNAAKLEEKRARALLRQNPYTVEIDACKTLVRYVQDHKVMVQREEAELARKQAAAAFDPSKFLPEGAVLLNDGKKFTAPQKGGAGGKHKTVQTQKQKPEKAPKNRVLQHPEDKIRLFQLINEEPPAALAAIDDAVERIRAKQKEYESHIKVGELELSSDDEEDEEAQEEEEAVAATEEEAAKGADEVEKVATGAAEAVVQSGEEEVKA